MQRKNEGKKGNNGYISLAEAAEYSGCYSQDYLSLRARQGKLKATKFGRNWVTKKEWLDEYIKQADGYKNNRHQVSVSKKSIVEKKEEDAKEPVKTIPTISRSAFQPVPRAQLIALVAALVFVLGAAGTLFAYPYFEPALKEVALDIGEFTSEIGEGVVEAGDEVSDTLYSIGSGTKAYGKALKEGSRQFGLKTVVAFKNFGANISDGAGLMAREVANKLARSQRFVDRGFQNGVAFIGGGVSEFFNDLTRYITQDIKVIKNFAQNISRTVLETFKKVPEKVVNIFKKEEIGEKKVPVPFFKNFGKAIGEGTEKIGDGVKKVGNKVARSRQFAVRGFKGFVAGVSGEIKDFGGDLKFGAVLFRKEVDEGLVGPIKDFAIKTTDDFIRYVSQDARAIKKGLQMLVQKIKQVPQKVVGIFKEEKPITELPEEIFTKEERPLPKPEKEGLVAVPSTGKPEKDEEIKQRIKASFSDGVRIIPTDEESGIIVPVFKEKEGQEYLYIMVPVNE